MITKLTETEARASFACMIKDAQEQDWSAFNWYQAGIETAEIMHGIKEDDDGIS
jgi:hypothetical protein